MTDTLNSVRAVLTTTPERWMAMARSLTPDLLLAPPAAGEWSAMECLVHLLDTENWVFPPRVQSFLRGESLQNFDPVAQGSKLEPGTSPTELATQFAQLRAKSLKELAEVTPADLDRQVDHSELGLVTLGEMLHEWAGHDLSHTMQAEHAIMQPFIQRAGPWRRYFAEHDVQSAADLVE